MMNSFMQQPQQSEVIRIPDRMVGLIIGKGGEQITAIQSESECRIQFAPADGSGFGEGRMCTLTGSPEAIEKAKDLMNQIMSKGHDYPPSMGVGMGGGEMNGMNNVSIQMMIPGNKAGIIIGKGGDTIKQLQEKAGVRMLIIQDSNSPTNYDKPLKITGDRDNVERAQEMVKQLLAEKDGMSGGGGFNDYGQRQTLEIAVPRSVIGIVIGKGGEMIKKLQQDSGARIQFKPDDEMSGQDRLCSIVGTSEQIQAAASMIQEIGENSGRGGMGDSNGWRPQRSNGMDGTFGNETSFSVPADKCGLVIGKGGETIREICRLSGAHVELNREASAMSSERIFRIQGSNEQMRHAIQLVSDKAGITPGQQDGMIGGLQVASPQTQQPQQQAALAGLYAAAVQAASPTQQLYQQQQQLQQLQQLQQQQQQLALQTSYQYPTAAYSQTAASVNSDLSKLALDSNQAVWQAYYSQVYNQMAAAGAQQSNAVAAAAASLQQQQLQSQQAHYALAGLPQQPLAAQQQSVVQPSSLAAATGGGAADYTAAWLDYYRQQGLHQQAQALLLAQAGGAAAPTNGISLQQQPQ